MSVIIVNNRVDGLRVTIYDVLHYLEAGRSAAEIADILSLTPEQVEAAVRYTDEHRDEVMTAHRRIEARVARGNPPEIEAHARTGAAARMGRVAADRVVVRSPDHNRCARHAGRLLMAKQVQCKSVRA